MGLESSSDSPRTAYLKEGSQGSAVPGVENQGATEGAQQRTDENGKAFITHEYAIVRLESSLPATSLHASHSNSNREYSESQPQHAPQPPSTQYSNSSTTLHRVVDVGQESLTETPIQVDNHNGPTERLLSIATPFDPQPTAAMFQGSHDFTINGQPTFVNGFVNRITVNQQSNRRQFLLLVHIIIFLFLPLYGFLDLSRAGTTTPQVVSTSQPSLLRPMPPRHRPKRPTPPPLLRATPPPSPSPS